jgi:glycerophosphoryl diester phosphodiesterase
MRTIAYIILLLSFAGCKKPTQAPNLNGGKIKVIGHGGAGLPGPNSDLQLNSKAGIDKALGLYQADGVEVDVKLSSDSVLFMYHDKQLESTTTCSGCMFELYASELSKCSFKPVTSSIGEVHYLTKLEDILAQYKNTKPTIFLDLHVDLGCNPSSERKQWYYTTTLYAIDNLLAKYSAYDNVLIQANSLDWLLEARAKFPLLKVLLDGDITEGLINISADNGFAGVASKNMDITKEEVELAHSKGLLVQIYGANGKSSSIEAINKGPEFILADNIPLLQNILNYQR